MTETTLDRKLFEIFDEAFDLYNSFETCTDPTNSLDFQVITSKRVRCCKGFAQPC